ncbi:MAG: hypothetical protein GWN00_37895, partial [Aliifodinibius sp.]|nr:hypothetical protein [Fodinibius sp.]NIV16372.1 hypothetical protein [Fodinibius sp.]NIY30350.1 hypothetical protein [Fodinibius sp.]
LTIYCQAQQLEFQHYSLEDGLSQTTVYDIIRDRQGFMWFATEDGLNRFDGYEFKVFKHDPLDSTTIAGNIILCLLEDAAGMVWIGTSKGLCQYNQQTETFMRYTNSSA